MLYVLIKYLFDFKSNKEILIYFVMHDIPLILHIILSVTMPYSFSSHGFLRSYVYLKDLSMFDPQNLRDFYGLQRSCHTMGDGQCLSPHISQGRDLNKLFL